MYLIQGSIPVLLQKCTMITIFLIKKVNIIQIHTYLCTALNINTLQLYFCYTKLINVIKQILYLLDFSYPEIVLMSKLKIYLSMFEIYFKYLAFKDWYYTVIILSLLIVILKYSLGFILRNVHCAINKYSK